MRTEIEAAPGKRDGELMKAVREGSKETRNSSPRSHLPHPRRLLWICVLAWTVFVLIALWWLWKGNAGVAVWVFLDQDLNQPGLTNKVRSIFRGELGLQRTYPWILFGPFLALVAWYFPLERERLRRNMLLNAVACLAFMGGCVAINARMEATHHRFLMVDSDPAPGDPTSETPGDLRGAREYAGRDRSVRFRRLPPPSPPGRLRTVSLRSMILDLLAYGAITGLVHSVNFYGRLRERERRALFLESKLASARLNTLKAQMQPHFLFNSLNAIAALLRRDPRLAETTLVALSELLRLALSQSEKQEISLREELELVQHYIEIQQTRFGDKLRVEQDIEPEALDCFVPTLVLQPLVENAIRHGIEPGDKPGLVRVTANREEGKLVLTVEDDGVGLAPGSQPVKYPLNAALPVSRSGIGLANLRERLEALYGAQQKLELTPRAGGGVIVRVEVPWEARGSDLENPTIRK